MLQPHQYDERRVGQWTNECMEHCIKRLTAMNKPYKYVVTCLIMQVGASPLVCVAHAVCACLSIGLMHSYAASIALGVAPVSLTTLLCVSRSSAVVLMSCCGVREACHAEDRSWVAHSCFMLLGQLNGW